MSTLCRLFFISVLLFAPAAAFAGEEKSSLADQIDSAMGPIADIALKIVFFGFEVTDGVTLPVVLILCEHRYNHRQQ